jgi:predicted transcriptional regulator YdeE
MLGWRYNFNKSNRKKKMEPKFIKKEEILLVGMSFYGDPFDSFGGWDDENEIGRLWNRFMTYLNTSNARIPHTIDQEAAFEVHIYNPETSLRGTFEVFVGLQVQRIETPPVELLVKVLPPTSYAVFTLRGEEIKSDWDMHIDQWIATAGYKRAFLYSIQYMDHRFKGVERLAESELDVYMPVRKA